jgi:hypothetical protein
VVRRCADDARQLDETQCRIDGEDFASVGDETTPLGSGRWTPGRGSRWIGPSE